MGQGQSRRNTYDHYYNALQQNRSIDLSQLSPYDVLGVAPNFTWDDLVKAYRKTALAVHPDKGGSEALFNLATTAFKTLAKEYKRRQVEKPHDVLKQEYQDFEDSKPATAKPDIQASENFPDKFNTFFQENKLADEDNDDDRGYEHMMDKSSKDRPDIVVPRIMKKFNEEKFNKTFEKVVKPDSKDVIVYKEPEPLVLAKKLNFTELGGKTAEFSTDPTKRNVLHYTDYQKAHTTQRLVDPRSVSKRKEYKTVTDYEADRNATTDKKLDEKEILYEKKKKAYAESQEEARIGRLKERDEKASKHYEKVSQLMLGLKL